MPITDNLSKGSSSDTGRPVTASLTGSGHSTGGTSVTVNVATNWPTDTVIYFAIFETTTVGSLTVKDTSTQTDWKGTLSGTTISNMTIVGGSDRDYSAGAIVELTMLARQVKDLHDWAVEEHNQDGTHSDISADTITTSGLINGGAVLADIVYFTSSGTWTKDSGLKFVIVEVRGGGASGGGTSSTSGGEGASASGGGAGGYCRKKILAASLSSTETVTIGAGGAASSVGGNGNDGGASSFGSHCSANGGIKGIGSGATASGLTREGGGGGTATGGDLNLTGSSGGNGTTHGGQSQAGFGGGGGPIGGGIVASTGTGATGNAPGGGGSGSSAGQNTAGRAGGAGAKGIVIVHEYY